MRHTFVLLAFIGIGWLRAFAAPVNSVTQIPRGYYFGAYAGGTGCAALTISGNAFTDSFDSSKGTYSETRLASYGHVASKGNLYLSGSANVNGSAFLATTSSGPCKGGNTGLTVEGKALLSGGIKALVSAPLLANIPVVTSSTQKADITTNTTLQPGAYGDVSISGKSAVNLVSGVYSVNSLTLSGGSSLVIGSDVEVVINVGGLKTDTPVSLSGGSIVNLSGNPRHLEIVYGGSGKISLSGGTSAYALVYSPNAAVTLSGGADWYGALVTKTLDDSGGSPIHFDRSLAPLPQISVALLPVSNLYGWQKSPLTATFTCLDPVTGIASCTAPLTIDHEWQAQVVTGTAVNNAGYTATVATTASLDKTIPLITATQAPPANSAGWNNTAVTVAFICSDALSGIASCTQPATVEANGAKQVVTGTAVDKAGNMASNSAVINLDQTPPTARMTLSPVANSAGWNNSDVTISFKCQDTLSGIGKCPETRVISAESVVQIDEAATDLAGNQASVAGVVRLDKTPPTLTVQTPTPDSSVAGATLSISGSISDALSGTATLTCGGLAGQISGSSFNCSVPLAVGNNSIALVATDMAGNSVESIVKVSRVIPKLLSLTPSSGRQGQSQLAVAIKGENTHFLQGSTTANFGPGITPVSLTVFDPTNAAATIDIDLSADTGARSVVLTTGVESLTLSNAFTIEVPVAPPKLISVLPNVAVQGSITTVALTGANTHFSQGVTTASFGAGISVDAISVVSPTNATATISVDSQAVLGKRVVSVNTGSEVVTLPDALSVTASGTPLISVNAGPDQTTIFATHELIVSSYRSANTGAGEEGISRYDAVSGSYIGPLAFIRPHNGMRQPAGVAVGPDGDIFVEVDGTTIKNTAGVLRFDGSSGVSKGLFVGLGSGNFTDGASIAFGPDKNLYVSDWAGPDVKKFDGQTGASLGSFAKLTSGVPTGLLFRADGNLWVCDSGNIEEFDSATGQFKRIAATLSPTINWGGYPVLMPSSGDLLVPGLNSNDVGRFSSVNGTPVGKFISSGSGGIARPAAAAYGPDGSYYLGAEGVYRFDGQTGAFQSVFVKPGNFQLGAAGLSFRSVGSDVALSASASMNGAAIDATATKTWSKVSGPGTVSFADPSALNTKASFSLPGQYVLRMTVASGPQASSSDDVAINVKLLNHAPVVDAGPPLAVVLPASVALQGLAGDDNRPTGASLAVKWSKVSGPGAASFADETSPTTTVGFSAGGTYVLRLTASDSEYTSSSDVTVIASGVAPLITSLVPATGQQGQSAIPVKITAQNAHFSSLSKIDLGSGAVASNVVAVDANTLQASLSISSTAATGTRALTVTTGSEVASLGNAFTVMPNVVSGPVISEIAPSSGPQGGNGPVSIAGLNTHFVAGASQIDFGPDISVDSVNVSCASCLSAHISIADNASVGPRDVKVVTGSETATLFAGFNVLSGNPYIHDFGPTTGVQGQTMTLTVNGKFSHFVNGQTQVSLGAGITPTITVLSPTSLTAQLQIASNATAGLRTLTVATGAEVLSVENKFKVVVPQPGPQQLTPTSAQQGQTNLLVAITGQNTHFAQGTTSVSFGAGINVASVTVSSPTVATAAVNVNSGAALGLRDVVVTTANEVITFASGFVVTGGPLLFVVNPNTAEPGMQNLPVTLTGSGTHFASNLTSVSFGDGISVTGVNVTSPTSATAVLNIDPAIATGLKTVSVTTGAETVSIVDGFAVNAPSILITEISPANAQQGQASLNVDILAYGTHFVAGTTTASFGAGISVGGATPGAPGPVNVLSSTSATAQISVSNLAALGLRTVSLATNSEQVLAPNAFLVRAANTPVPVISSVTPNNGFAGQSVNVTITGQLTHFSQGSTQVSFGGGVTVTGVSVTSATSLTATLAISASAAPGPRPATVITGSEQAVLAGAFLVKTGTNQAPVITISTNWSAGITTPLTLSYSILDDHLPSGGTLTVNWSQVSGPPGVSIPDFTISSAQATFPAAGTYVLRLTASDSLLTTSKDITVTVSDSGSSTTDALISNLNEGQEITAPTKVTGSVQSANLKSWALEFRMVEESVFRPFATGTAPVSNGVLGTFDPTTLLNGQALIRLKVTDSANSVLVTDPISVVLTKNMKVGNFTLSFDDLTIPMAGLPIQVVRTYDSRVKSAGDFGVGWTLDLKAARITENRPVGKDWTGTVSGTQFSTVYCVQPVKPHVITVALSDGSTHVFDVALANNGCQALQPPSEVVVNFLPRAGTTSSLAMTVDNHLYYGWNIGAISLLDFDGNLIDPVKYKLTLADGRVLMLNRDFGVESIADLNGNTVTFTAGGIIHSGGKSVTFTRDLLGRITKVTDPSGNTLGYGYDGNADLVSFENQSQETTSFTYDGNHYLISIKDPRGVQPIRNEFDAAGRIISHTDAFGKTITYSHDLNNRQEIVTDRLGNVTVNEYDERGNVVTTTDALGGVRKRTYDSRDNLLTETDALNHKRTFTYDSQDNRLSETDPLGNTTTYTYNDRKQVTSVTDPAGNSTSNVYDLRGNLTSAKNAAGFVTSYTYTLSGQQDSITDALGNITTFQYDGSGNLVKKIEPKGGTVATYTYDANGNRKTENRIRTTSFGSESLVTSSEYDAQNRVIKTVSPDGGSNQVQFNNIGKQSVTTDPLGRQTQYTYDSGGRLIRTDFPDGTNEQSVYDQENHRIESLDRGGRSTSYLYDAVGRLTKTTYADGAESQTFYDAVGRVAKTVDALGNPTSYAYDAAGHRTAVTNALNQTTSFVYDKSGNQTRLTDGNGNAIQHIYDALNRRTITTYADSTTDQVKYDALGRTVQKTDQDGKTTQYSYDAMGRLLAVTDAKNQVTSYSYDEVGNRLTQTDANLHTTTFAYDKMGRRIKRTLPLGIFETFAYDLSGQVKNKTDFNGRLAQFQYDASGRLVSKTADASLNEPVTTFTYFASSQRQQMVDASGTTTYLYDNRDRLIQKATPQGTLSYTYDKAGNLSTVRSSNANGTSVDYTYDQLNRLSAVKDNRLAAGTTTYLYDNAGNLKIYLYPNGVQSTFTYSVLDRLSEMTITKGSTTLAGYSYTLGKTGNRIAVAEFGGRQVNYGYDDLYRLTSETVSGAAVSGTISYQYDAVGNRLARTSTVAPVPSAAYSYDDNDRLKSDTYDANGNTLLSSGSTYSYDSENRLQSANAGAVTIIYDGDGNRVQKTASGVTTRYLVDDRNLTGYAQVFEELSAGSVERVYTYGLSRISQRQATGTSFYGYDGHGSVRLLTDGTGTVTDRYDYDAFGNIIGQAGSTPNVYLYSGEQNDPNLGFYYLRARYLDQSKARFLTLDTYESSRVDPRNLHLYLYALGNPVNRIDPSGRFSLAELNTTSAIQGILRTIQTGRIYAAWQTFERFRDNYQLGIAAGHSVYALLSPTVTFTSGQGSGNLVSTELKLETHGIYRDTGGHLPDWEMKASWGFFGGERHLEKWEFVLIGSVVEVGAEWTATGGWSATAGLSEIPLYDKGGFSFKLASSLLTAKSTVSQEDIDFSLKFAAGMISAETPKLKLQTLVNWF